MILCGLLEYIQKIINIIDGVIMLCSRVTTEQQFGQSSAGAYSQTSKWRIYSKTKGHNYFVSWKTDTSHQVRYLPRRKRVWLWFIWRTVSYCSPQNSHLQHQPIAHVCQVRPSTKSPALSVDQPQPKIPHVQPRPTWINWNAAPQSISITITQRIRHYEGQTGIWIEARI